MRISELARRGGGPVATVKYYLPERLLHEGVLTSPTQARYDDSHLAKLRLIRALLGPGGLSVARARDVLAAIAAPPPDTYDLLGVAAAAIGHDAARPGGGDRHGRGASGRAAPAGARADATLGLAGGGEGLLEPRGPGPRADRPR